MIPTADQFLAKLEASAGEAAAFDRATRRERPHCKSRREAVEAVLNAVRATVAENAALKSKVAATKEKLAALATAKATHASLTAQLATSKARLAIVKATPPPAKPSPALNGYDLAREAFSRKPLPKSPITRADFQKLTPDERTRYAKQGGKLIL